MELAADEVHLWAVDLARTQQECDELAGRLSADELRRAANMRVAAARRRFVVARGSLRLLLGRYLDAAPAEIEIVTGEHGKPAVDGASFNLTHSGELCLVAVTRERDVGVDVELLRPRTNPAAMARRYFTAAESAAVAAAPDTLTSFYAHWVAKEALLKATGDGIAGRLQSFEVAFDPRPRFVHVRGDAATRWSLAMLAVPRGYVAALVTDGALRRSPLRRFDPAVALAR